MLKDENRALYAGVLAICGVALASSVYFSRPEIEVAVVRPGQTTDFGAIETATTRAAEGPEGAAEWNYPDIPWRNYEEGMEKAAREEKPVLLVLQASWCLTCRDYQRLFKAPEIAEYSDEYVFILADIDKEPELQQRYNIDGDYIPRTFVLEADGRLRRSAQGRYGGYRYFVDPYSLEALLAVLRSGASR